MTTPSSVLAKLSLPFPEDTISWRVGAKAEDNLTGQALPYIDNRVIQNLLDETVGPANWKNEYVEVTANGKLLAVRCKLSIYVDSVWVGKEDAAPFSPTDGSSHAWDLALKGVYSDAMKRAAVHWGIGRYLYAFRAPWVPLNDRQRLISAPALPPHLLPAGDTPRATTAAQPGERAAPTAEKPAETPRVAADAPNTNRQASQESKGTAQAAPKAVPLKAESSGSDAGLEGIPEEQRILVSEVLAKLTKNVTPQMIRNYVEGPAGMKKLNPQARAYVLEKLNLHEHAQEKAGATEGMAT